MLDEVKQFEIGVVPDLRLYVENDGHYLNVVWFPKDAPPDVSALLFNLLLY